MLCRLLCHGMLSWWIAGTVPACLPSPCCPCPCAPFILGYSDKRMASPLLFSWNLLQQPSPGSSPPSPPSAPAGSASDPPGPPARQPAAAATTVDFRRHPPQLSALTAALMLQPMSKTAAPSVRKSVCYAPDCAARQDDARQEETCRIIAWARMPSTCSHFNLVELHIPTVRRLLAGCLGGQVVHSLASCLPGKAIEIRHISDITDKVSKMPNIFGTSSVGTSMTSSDEAPGSLLCQGTWMVSWRQSLESAKKSN